MTKLRDLKIEDITDQPRKYTFRDLLHKDTLMELLHDELMEPHVHLAILLIILFVVAVIVGIIDYVT